MVRARTSVGVAIPVVGNEHVPHLRVDQAMDQLPVDHAAPTDARADGQVDEGVQSLGSAPAVFAQGGGVYVGIEAHRYTQRPPDRSGNIGVSPARLGRGGDVAEGGRIRLRIHWAKRGDADGCQRLVFLMLLKKPNGPADGLFWSGGGKARLRSDIVRAAAHRAHEFRATGLNPSPKWRHPSPSLIVQFALGRLSGQCLLLSVPVPETA